MVAQHGRRYRAPAHRPYERERAWHVRRAGRRARHRARQSTGHHVETSTSDTVADGTVAQTRWGTVQVQVRVSGGKTTDVTVLQQPSGNRTDREINSFALPQLRQQVLQAQSANIDGVSGATITSDGCRQSLQDALAAANFGR